MSKITIKTHLNSGIYKSDGGGETRTHHEITTGPRNLIKAIELFFEHRATMTRCYGNIGCGKSWLEIDDQQISHLDMMDIMEDDREIYGRDSSLIKSRTQKARELIASVAAGEYSYD